MTSLSDTETLLMGLLLLLSFGLCFLYWRLAVAFALVFLVAEGALRKWVFPEWGNLIYWIKDIALAASYARFYLGRILQRRPVVPPHPFNFPISLLLLYGFVEVLNPYLPSLLVGVLGFKAYFGYVPLFYMLPELFATKRALFRFLVFYALLSIPVAALGVAQHYSPLDNPIVSYVEWEGQSFVAGVSVVGAYARVSSTFSFISGYAAYLFFITLILLALVTVRRGGWPRLAPLLFAALILAVSNIFMTGSRWPLLTLLTMTPVFIFMVSERSVSRMAAALRLTAVLGFVAIASTILFGEAVRAFVFRVQTSGDLGGRIYQNLTRQFRNPDYRSAWGFGIGSTHQAARFLVGSDDYTTWLPTADFENEPERVMIEMGPLGFALFYFVKVALLLHCGRLPRQLRDRDLRVLSVVAFIVQPSLFFWPTVFNVTAALYFWAVSGFLLLLPKLDRAEGASGGG